MQLNPATLSGSRVLAAYVIFFAIYFVFALGKFPGLKIDRRLSRIFPPRPAADGNYIIVGNRLADLDSLNRLALTTLPLDVPSARTIS